MVVKSNVKATPTEIEQLKNLLEGKSFYNISLMIGVSDCTVKKYYHGEGVSERMASSIKAFLRRQASIKDNVARSAIQELEDISNLLITKGDTQQRETFLKCLERACTCLKVGKKVSFEVELDEITPCVLKLV